MTLSYQRYPDNRYPSESPLHKYWGLYNENLGVSDWNLGDSYEMSIEVSESPPMMFFSRLYYCFVIFGNIRGYKFEEGRGGVARYSAPSSKS